MSLQDEEKLAKEIAKLQNELNFKKSLREINLQRLRLLKKNQDKCPHLTGQDYHPGVGPGYSRNLWYAFSFLKLPTGEVVGVCKYCQKRISSIDPADKELFQKTFTHTNEIMAESGQFLKKDKIQVFGQLARFTPEDQTRILKDIIWDLKTELKGIIEEPLKPELNPVDGCKTIYSVNLDQPDYYEMPLEDLKEIAKEQLKNFRTNPQSGLKNKIY